ncbi:MAG: hypothetical protein AB2563_10875 [Candidatus Thiodiazotropha endolucinida]
MTNNKGIIKRLPEWFDWNDYEVLIGIKDLSVWSYQFAIRDPNYTEENKIGTHFGVFPETFENRLWKTDWRNGVLSDGMNGHKTHNYLRGIVEYASKDADYLTAEELSKAKSDGTLSQYATRRTKSTGALCFKTKEDYEKYRAAESAAFSRTVELAINMMMPKKMIMSEVESLIDRYQKGRFRTEYSLARNDKQIRLTNKQQTWARGLACWDLHNDGISIYLIAKLLAKDWFNFKDSLGPQKNREGQVKTLLNDVVPLINGGWKALAGDPTVSMDSPLLKKSFNDGG